MKQTVFSLLTTAIVLLSGTAYAQKYTSGIPFLQNYTTDDYNGQNQVFSIVQDDRGIIYFANNTSILEYTGNSWRQIFMPEKSTIYALRKDKNGRIYVGASKGELGYLNINKQGVLEYVSLQDKLPEDDANFNFIRSISFTDKGEILFISPLTIYIYDGNQFNTFNVTDKDSPDNRFVVSFEVDNQIFIQERARGLLRYTGNNKFELLPGTEMFNDIWITGILPTETDSLLFITRSDKKYKYHKGEVSESPLHPLLQNMYCYAEYQDSLYAVGLLGEGIVLINNKAEVLLHVSMETGLQNNTVYAIFTDRDGNTWAGLSNGISVLHTHSPYTIYDGRFGLVNTTLTAKQFEDNLYIGNSTGVYYMDIQNRQPTDRTQFKEIINEKGSFQIWHIDTIDGKLFCGGTSGLFTVENGEAKYVRADESIKAFQKHKYRDNVIMAVGGNGISKYIKRNDKWTRAESIRGFDLDFRYITQANDTIFWVSDRNKGLVKLSLCNKLETVVEKKEYGEEHGLPQKTGNRVFQYADRLIFATESGIYEYDKKTDRFKPDPFFDKILGSNIAVTDFMEDQQGNVWYKEKLTDPKTPNKNHWELGLIKAQPDFTINKAPFYKLRNNIHSLYALPDDKILIGTERGFIVYDYHYPKNFKQEFHTYITRVETIRKDSLLFGGSFSDTTGLPLLKQNPNRIPILPFEYRDVRFNFSAGFFEEPEKTVFKHILEGYHTEWSDWKHETMEYFPNLEPGKYTFKVIAKNLYGTESSEAVYKFEILPPYYRTVWAYMIYTVLFGLFTWGIVILSTIRIKRQKENLERIVAERTKQIKAQNIELNKRNEEIRRKNKDITSSINYAKRIQDAMLPIKNNMKAAFDDSFILFKPRDIVSGDFYWFEQKNNKIIITAVDCTGHGVPGAFMSLIGSEIISSIVNQKGITNAAEILEQMNLLVVAALKQEATANQDGMDLALCVIDKDNKTLEFAGAKNPLVYIYDDKIEYIKGSRKGIGGHQEADAYTMHTIKYKSPTAFYIFSDGYQDQFGGPDNRKFMIKNLRKLLFDIHKLPFAEQHKILDETIENWMQKVQQTDDILLMGFKL